jgi:ATP-binding cassette subfamily B protein
MDEDARDMRSAPADWREYLHYAKETGDLFRWTWKIIPPESKRRCKWLLVALVCQTVALLLLPRFIGALVDGAVRHSGSLLSMALFGAMACLTAALALDYLFAVNREWILGLNWGAIDQHITKEFFGKSVGQHIHDSSRLAVSNIDKGRWRLLDLQGMLLFEGVPALVSLMFTYIFLWVFMPSAGAIMTVGIVVYLVYTLYLNRQVMVVATPLDAEFRKLNRYRVERWEKVERVKTSTRGAEEIVRTDKWFGDVIARDRIFWIWFIKQCMFRGMVSRLCLMATLGYLSFLVWHQYVAAAMFLPVFWWGMQLVENIWRIGHIEHQLNWNAPSVRSMIEAVSIVPNVQSGETSIVRTAPIEIAFDEVHYRYPGEENSESEILPVLDGVNFSIGAGEKIALIGESGAGKTTVMRLLLRYMDPTAGIIRIQGHDLKDLNLDSWWSSVGYIPQQPQIIDGTLRDNLTYALSPGVRAATTDEELWDLMRLLKIDFGKRLTAGLDTLVGKNGLKLSGGQAQRLMIGAAAVKKPAFMVIDEATSSLDSTTEKAVQCGLAQVLTKNVGALVVAHRLSTVRHLCDRFIVLRSAESLSDGASQIEAIGSSFEELYDVSLVFRRLVEDQGISIRLKNDTAATHLIP